MHGVRGFNDRAAPLLPNGNSPFYQPVTAQPGHSVLCGCMAQPTPCEACVADPSKFWCYNDGKCYSHGDPVGDAKCPGTAHCAASNGKGCACTSCGDSNCAAEKPQTCESCIANEKKFWC